MSNAAREALVFIAACIAVGTLAVLLIDILRKVRGR